MSAIYFLTKPLTTLVYSCGWSLNDFACSVLGTIHSFFSTCPSHPTGLFFALYSWKTIRKGTKVSLSPCMNNMGRVLFATCRSGEASPNDHPCITLHSALEVYSSGNGGSPNCSFIWQANSSHALVYPQSSTKHLT